MSYDNEFAKSTPQEVAGTRNLWHDFAVMPAFVYPVGVALIMALSGVNLLICALIITGAILYQNHLSKQEALKEARARAAGFANCAGPIVVSSQDPNEGPEQVAERARAFRENLRMSGNPYAEIIPIIEMPYAPMIYSNGQFSMGFTVYQACVDARRYEENMKWYNGKCPDILKPHFAAYVLPTPQPK